MVRGSTMSNWTLGSSLELSKNDLIQVDEKQRYIGDYVSSIVKGVVMEPTSLKSKLFGPKSRVPWIRLLSFVVLANSIFSRTGWVKRKLTVS